MAGLLTGYLVVKRPNLKMIFGGRKMAILLWLALSAGLVAIFAWHCTFWKVNVVADSASVAAWMVFSKVILLAWVSFTVYVCCTGRCGKFGDKSNLVKMLTLFYVFQKPSTSSSPSAGCSQ